MRLPQTGTVCFLLLITIAPASAAEREKVIRNSIGMSLTLVPAGEFQMGSHESQAELAKAFPTYKAQRIESLTDEQPPHRVRITRPFYFGTHEVTIGDFKKFVADQKYQSEAERDGTGGYGYNPKLQDFEGRNVKYSWRDAGYPQDDDHPVVNVTWNDAVAFCQWLSQKEGKTYRLPTEAEWEYACRGGRTARYNFGDDPEQLVHHANIYDQMASEALSPWKKYAVSGSDGFKFTAPVGSFPANGFGLHDMHGNVWEWTADWYSDLTYRSGERDDPTGPRSGRMRVRRGGAWHTWPLYTRAAFRNYNTPQSRYVNLGFRVVREVE